MDNTMVQWVKKATRQRRGRTFKTGPSIYEGNEPDWWHRIYFPVRKM